MENMKINIPEKFKVLQGFTWSHSRAVMVVKFGNRKFQLIYNNTNGSSPGFQDKFSARIMTSEGTWAYILDKKDVGFSNIPYVSSEEERKQDAVKFFEEVLRYIEVVYS